MRPGAHPWRMKIVRAAGRPPGNVTRANLPACFRAGRCHEQGLTADCPLGRTSGPKCTLVIGPCHNTGVPRCTADCIFEAA